MATAAYKCKCGRGFDSQKALNVHNASKLNCKYYDKICASANCRGFAKNGDYCDSCRAKKRNHKNFGNSNLNQSNQLREASNQSNQSNQSNGAMESKVSWSVNQVHNWIAGLSPQYSKYANSFKKMNINGHIMEYPTSGINQLQYVCPRNVFLEIYAKWKDVPYFVYKH